MSADLCLTARDLAAMFGVSERTAQKWAHRITSELTGTGCHRVRKYSASHAACLRAAGEPGSLVPVGHVLPGDVLSLDGQPVLVTAVSPASYWYRGPREGMAVEWRRGTARGVFARSAGDRIVRLRQVAIWAAAA